MEVITRVDAKAIGQKWFYTGEPCKNGHIDKISVASRTCYQCNRDYKKKRLAENGDRIRELKRASYYRNFDKIAAKVKEKLPSIREQRNSYLKEYYKKTREQQLEYAKKYFQENKDKIYEYKSSWGKTEAGIINQKRAKANRRVLESNGKIKAKELKALVKNSNGQCYWCNTEIDITNSSSFHFDHYEPLAKGGLNLIENIVISCPSCNMNKKAKDPREFANTLGRLL